MGSTTGADRDALWHRVKAAHDAIDDLRAHPEHEQVGHGLYSQMRHATDKLVAAENALAAFDAEHPGGAAGAKDELLAAVGVAKDTVRRAADHVGVVAQQAYERGQRYLDEGKRRYPEVDRAYRDGQAIVRAQVSESPIAALLIAGAVGYGLALLTHRRD